MYCRFNRDLNVVPEAGIVILWANIFSYQGIEISKI